MIPYLVPLSGVVLRQVLGSGNEITNGGCLIHVRDSEKLISKQLYADKDGTVPLPNPFRADVSGQFVIYTTEGQVNVTVSKGASMGSTVMTLFDPFKYEAKYVENNPMTSTGDKEVKARFLGQEVYFKEGLNTRMFKSKLNDDENALIWMEILTQEV